MIKDKVSTLTCSSLARASSFLFFSRSDEETQSMLSSVVASRSVSSDNANLFFAAERPDTYVGGGVRAVFTWRFMI